MSEIRFLSLRTACLASITKFYRELLELPLLAQGPGYAVFLAGATQLMWEQADAGEPFYHFAIDIPCNQLSAAAEWLSQRMDLLTQDGKREFEFEDWNASSIYFHDPAGNIVECIARRNLKNGNEEAFSPRQFLRLSEIGWPVSKAHSVPARLELELEAWRDYGALKAMGTETGLILLVPEGRGWLPTRRPAEIHPCSIALHHQGRMLRYQR